MQRSQLLDLLRIFAILLVFIAHFGQLFNHNLGDFFGIKNFYYVSLGGVGVTLFLLLSGLLLGLTDGNKKRGYFAFIGKKLKRIYPLYWICLPLSLLGYVLGSYVAGDGLPDLAPNGLLVDLFGTLTGFYAWLSLWGGPYNAPSWFIGLIISLYAVGPLLLFGLKRFPYIVLLILLLISVLSRWYVGQEGIPLVSNNLYDEAKGWAYRQFGFMPGRPTDWFPLCRIFEFGFGIYLGLVVPKRVWFSVNLPGQKISSYLSDLAFPLFLLHLPWLFFVEVLIDKGMPTSVSIAVFMLLLVVLAQGVTKLESMLLAKLGY
ncbi:acyltransferase family protein [Reinekea thalattae]|uniref:Acyltransferase family protein n=2 Tax=Reinekea thalattae TaxID=2593301 RepID=A0A5C8Z4T5_9GAMM|nr:acyltransferase family protein [Reinekea thalattae]